MLTGLLKLFCYLHMLESKHAGVKSCFWFSHALNATHGCRLRLQQPLLQARLAQQALQQQLPQPATARLLPLQ